RQPPAAPTHHALDCLLCALCLAHAMPLPTPANPPSVPAPRLAAVAPDERVPPATSPPVARPVAAQPRGPPPLA
ncbi:MAG TPA: hypothetical protein VFW75_05770, partial [Acetobacteraceae bacterium]|nr:hypothetical protein [Acetobacteraceae bacterium]